MERRRQTGGEKRRHIASEKSAAETSQEAGSDLFSPGE